MPYQFKHSPGRLSQDLSQAFGRKLLEEIKKKQLDVHIPEWSTLSFLTHEKKANQKEIGVFMGQEKVFVKRTLDRMESKGWIIRMKDPDDKRYNLVVLTPEGEEVFKQIAPLAQKTIKKAKKDIHSSLYEKFKEVSNQMIRNLES